MTLSQFPPKSQFEEQDYSDPIKGPQYQRYMDAVSEAIGTDYIIVGRLGGGSFGEIFLALDTFRRKLYAIKTEHSTTRQPQLAYEHKVYRLIAGGVGIPNTYRFVNCPVARCLVMDLCGPSLETLFNWCGRRFSLKTTLMLADQMLSRIEYIHAKCFIHRDIKPDNFVIGFDRRTPLVHLIDFGLAKRFKDPRTGVHIPFRDRKSMIGTARYASISTHLGIEPSRRDDLESFFYILVYFASGKPLPWMGIKESDREVKFRKIWESKYSTPVDILCEGLPKEFMLMYRYIRSLRFEDRPDYGYIRRLIRSIFLRSSFSFDFNFDWVMLDYDFYEPINKIFAGYEGSNLAALERYLSENKRPLISELREKQAKAMKAEKAQNNDTNSLAMAISGHSVEENKHDDLAFY